MVAALALTGMQPYQDISTTSGFPNAFRWNHVEWAAQLAAVRLFLAWFLPLAVDCFLWSHLTENALCVICCT
jgi:hypothetical protein